MSKAQKGSAELEDVSEETFVRFCQWAHNCYHVAPNSEILEAASSQAAPGPGP